MTSPEFAFIPDWSAELAINPRIAKLEFGDGYAQRAAKGLNTQLERVSLTFSGRTDKEAAAIMAFFKDKGGVASFTAQIGFSAPIKKYVTEGEWSLNMAQFNFNTVTVTFQEVP
jgi:phage-related protein